MRVEGHHPLAHCLPRDTTDRRRLGARGAVIDRRQRQQAPGLVGIPRGFRQRTHVRRVVIFPKPQCC
jgi:hypothetical protein